MVPAKTMRPTPKLTGLVPDPLTFRETALLRLIAVWQTNEDIARSLNYSKSAIKSHVQSILVKLAVKDHRRAANKDWPFAACV